MSFFFLLFLPLQSSFEVLANILIMKFAFLNCKYGPRRKFFKGDHVLYQIPLGEFMPWYQLEPWYAYTYEAIHERSGGIRICLQGGCWFWAKRRRVLCWLEVEDITTSRSIPRYTIYRKFAVGLNSPAASLWRRTSSEGDGVDRHRVLETGKELILDKATTKALVKKLHEPMATIHQCERIELKPTTCEAFGEIVDCIRVEKK